MFALALTAFTTLLVTIGPVEVASVFLAVTQGEDRAARLRIALSACAIATIVLLAFAFGGTKLLELLGVGLPAFRTAGGVLLLKLAADLLLAHRSELTTITRTEEREAANQDNVAAFPLAIPMIAGPGSMTAMVLLMGLAPDIGSQGLVIAILLVVMAITFVALVLSDRLMRVLGVTGSNVIARVAGLFLAGLAMQFVFDGLMQSGIFS